MKVKVDTIVRTVMLFVALINQVLTMSGKNPLPFADEDLYQALTLILTIAVTIWAWWKNNSFTDAAIIGDTLKDQIKAGLVETLTEEDSETEEGTDVG